MLTEQVILAQLYIQTDLVIFEWLVCQRLYQKYFTALSLFLKILENCYSFKAWFCAYQSKNHLGSMSVDVNSTIVEF